MKPQADEPKAEPNKLKSRDREALRNWDVLPDVANVRVPVVASLAGCSIPTVWRRVRNGNDPLPKPHKTSPKVTVWNVGELRKYLALRVTA
jgi:predicted DNA-binding transcriptional regulator AlpA